MFILFSNKAHQCLLPQRSQNETRSCESCGSKDQQLINEKYFIEFFVAMSSSQWYQYGTTQVHTKLCAECWIYYKKMGSVKYPRKSGKNLFLTNDWRNIQLVFKCNFRS